MGKSLASVLPTVLLAVLLFASPGPLLGPAAADMPPVYDPGTHPLSETATVELGPWTGYTARFVRIEPGDTLGGIAREHLGSFKRWKEIVELNAVDPQALAVGSEILLPPMYPPLPPGTGSDPQRPDARAWWDFFVLPGYGDEFVRHRPEVAIPPWGTGGRLVAIRHDKTADVLKRIAAEPVGAGAALDRLAPEAAEWLARSDVLTRGLLVKDENPTWTLERHWRVASISNGRIALEKVLERRLGRDGKEIVASSPPPAAGSDPLPPGATDATPGGAGPPARWDLILVFLALLAAIGIAVVYAQRARRRATGEPASSASA